MKKIILLFMCIFAVAIAAAGQDVPAEPFQFTWHTLVLIIAGIYEVLARLIPTIKDISILGKIIEILLWISNFLNVKKKKK